MFDPSFVGEETIVEKSKRTRREQEEKKSARIVETVMRM